MESVYRSSETAASIIGFQWLIRLGLDLETKELKGCAVKTGWQAMRISEETPSNSN